MTKEEIIKGNTLIAEFMDWNYYTPQYTGWRKLFNMFTKAHYYYQDNGRTYRYTPEDMEFDYSWDWIKRVIDRIVDISSDNPESEIYKQAGIVCSTHICCSIETVYEKIINFINWYNKNQIIL